jgi:hypothetical protein
MVRIKLTDFTRDLPRALGTLGNLLSNFKSGISTHNNLLDIFINFVRRLHYR